MGAWEYGGMGMSGKLLTTVNGQQPTIITNVYL